MADLRLAGTAEVEGGFTLSPQAAVKAMRRFRLPDPHMYLLQMVAAAAGTVSSLQIETAPRSLIFTFPGMEITEAQLRVMDTFLFPGVGPAHLTELAVGVEAALNLAEEVQIEANAGEVSWRLAISARSVKLEPFEMDSSNGMCTRVVVKKKREMGMVWRSKKHPELEWLETCRHADLELRVNGALHPTEPMPVVPPETILWVKVVKSGGPMENPHPAIRDRGLEAALTVEHESIFGYLALVHPEFANRHGLLFIHRGLVVHRPLGDLGMSAVCGVLHCDHLKKDLSHTNFVEDTEFEATRTFLRELCVKLVVKFCSELHLHQSLWKHMWPPVVGLLERDDLQPEQQQLVRDWAEHVSRTGEAQSPFADVQKARFLEREGQGEEARQLREALAEKTQTEALKLFDECRLDELIDPCGVLLELSKDLQTDSTDDLILAQLMLSGLLGQPIELSESLERDEPLALHRLALISRWKDALPTAIEYHLRALEHPGADLLVRGWGIRYCAELEFSQKRFGQAMELYSMAQQELPQQRDLWEERSYFLRFLGVEHRSESFALLRRAVEGVEVDSFVHLLLVEELKREGKSVLSRSELAALQTKSTYLKLKRLLEEGAGAHIEEVLARTLDLQGWVSRDDFISEKLDAVTQAERAFGPTYLYTRYCRRRCAYQLHRLGAEKEAEHLQCRGHLLDHLRMIIRGFAF